MVSSRACRALIANDVRVWLPCRDFGSLQFSPCWSHAGLIVAIMVNDIWLVSFFYPQVGFSAAVFRYTSLNDYRSLPHRRCTAIPRSSISRNSIDRSLGNFTTQRCQYFRTVRICQQIPFEFSLVHAPSRRCRYSFPNRTHQCVCRHADAMCSHFLSPPTIRKQICVEGRR